LARDNLKVSTKSTFTMLLAI